MPPLKEQQRIVDFLDIELDKINKTVNRVNHEIDLIREYRARLIADVVTGKLDVRGVKLRTVDEMAMLDEPLADDVIEEGEELEPTEEGVYADN